MKGALKNNDDGNRVPALENEKWLEPFFPFEDFSMALLLSDKNNLPTCWP